MTSGSTDRLYFNYTLGCDLRINNLTSNDGAIGIGNHSTIANFYNSDGSTGGTTLFTSGSTLFRYNDKGQLNWNAEFTTPDNDPYLCVCTDNVERMPNIYLGGYSTAPDGQGQFYNFDGTPAGVINNNFSTASVGFLTKYGGNGYNILASTIQGSQSDSTIAVSLVKSDSQNNITIAGIYSNTTQLNFGYYDDYSYFTTIGNLSTVNKSPFLATYGVENYISEAFILKTDTSAGINFLEYSRLSNDMLIIGSLEGNCSFDYYSGYRSTAGSSVTTNFTSGNTVASSFWNFLHSTTPPYVIENFYIMDAKLFENWVIGVDIEYLFVTGGLIDPTSPITFNLVDGSTFNLTGTNTYFGKFTPNDNLCYWLIDLGDLSNVSVSVNYTYVIVSGSDSSNIGIIKVYNQTGVKLWQQKSTDPGYIQFVNNSYIGFLQPLSNYPTLYYGDDFVKSNTSEGVIVAYDIPEQSIIVNNMAASESNVGDFTGGFGGDLNMVQVGWFAQGVGVQNGTITDINTITQLITIDPLENQQFVPGKGYYFKKSREYYPPTITTSVINENGASENVGNFSSNFYLISGIVQVGWFAQGPRVQNGLVTAIDINAGLITISNKQSFISGQSYYFTLEPQVYTNVNTLYQQNVANSDSNVGDFTGGFGTSGNLMYVTPWWYAQGVGVQNATVNSVDQTSGLITIDQDFQSGQYYFFTLDPVPYSNSTPDATNISGTNSNVGDFTGGFFGRALLYMVQVGWYAQGPDVLDGIVTNIDYINQLITIDATQQFLGGSSYYFTQNLMTPSGIGNGTGLFIKSILKNDVRAITSMAIDSDNSLIGAGYFFTPANLYNIDGSTAVTLPTSGSSFVSLLYKYNSTGSLLWDAGMTPSSVNNNAIYTSVCTDNFNNIIIGGYNVISDGSDTNFYNADGSTGTTIGNFGENYSVGFITKYTQDGVSLWSASIQGSNQGDIGFVKSSPFDNSITLSGFNYSGSGINLYNADGSLAKTIDYTLGGSCPLLATYSSSGNLLSSFFIDGNANYSVIGMENTNLQDNMILYGRASGNCNFNKVYTFTNLYNSSYILDKNLNYQPIIIRNLSIADLKLDSHDKIYIAGGCWDIINNPNNIVFYNNQTHTNVEVSGTTGCLAMFNSFDGNCVWAINTNSITKNQSISIVSNNLIIVSGTDANNQDIIEAFDSTGGRLWIQSLVYPGSLQFIHNSLLGYSAYDTQPRIFYNADNSTVGNTSYTTQFNQGILQYEIRDFVSQDADQPSYSTPIYSDLQPCYSDSYVGIFSGGSFNGNLNVVQVGWYAQGRDVINGTVTNINSDRITIDPRENQSFVNGYYYFFTQSQLSYSDTASKNQTNVASTNSNVGDFTGGFISNLYIVQLGWYAQGPGVVDGLVTNIYKETITIDPVQQFVAGSSYYFTNAPITQPTSTPPVTNISGTNSNVGNFTGGFGGDLNIVELGWFAQGPGVINGIVTDINTNNQNNQTITIDSGQNQEFVAGQSYYFTKYPINSTPPCFKDDTKITILQDGIETYVPINEINVGDLVKTHNNEYIPVLMVGKCMITHSNDKTRHIHKLYKYSKNKNNSLIDDLVITGAHSILVDKLCEEQESMTKKIYGKIKMIGDKYLLLSAMDPNAVIYEKNGIFIVYHIALDDTTIYGIYANGMLAESCTKEYIEKCMYRD
jgi:hypothetical protein